MSTFNVGNGKYIALSEHSKQILLHALDFYQAHAEYEEECEHFTQPVTLPDILILLEALQHTAVVLPDLTGEFMDELAKEVSEQFEEEHPNLNTAQKQAQPEVKDDFNPFKSAGNTASELDEFFSRGVDSIGGESVKAEETSEEEFIKQRNTLISALLKAVGLKLTPSLINEQAEKTRKFITDLAVADASKRYNLEYDKNLYETAQKFKKSQNITSFTRELIEEKVEEFRDTMFGIMENQGR